MKKLEKLRDSLEMAICSCFVASIFFYVSQFIYLGPTFLGNDPIYFFILQAIIGIFGVLFPYWLRTEKQIMVSPKLHCFYLLFLFAALFLGELCHFYLFFANWDLLLHFLSGFLIFCVTIEWLEKSFSLKNSKKEAVLVLAFLVALSVGSIWEIYEFINDGMLKTNMQRFQNAQNVAFIGRNAVVDTMSDLIFDCFGALFGAILRLKSKKN